MVAGTGLNLARKKLTKRNPRKGSSQETKSRGKQEWRFLSREKQKKRRLRRSRGRTAKVPKWGNLNEEIDSTF